MTKESAEQESLQLQVKDPGGPGHSRPRPVQDSAPTQKSGPPRGGISSEHGNRKSECPLHSYHKLAIHPASTTYLLQQLTTTQNHSYMT